MKRPTPSQEAPNSQRPEDRFRGHITPDTGLVRYEVSLKQIRRGKLAPAVANGRLFADGACVYTATDLRVGMITSGV